MSNGTAATDTQAPVRLSYPIRIAAKATWRLTITVVCVCVLPIAAVSVLLGAVGFDSAVTLPLLAVAITFSLSFFAHELGHSVTYWLIARATRGRGEMIGSGTFQGARIVRWATEDSGDALVALVGPLAGTSLALPFLLPSSAFVFTFPVVFLFVVHFVSLLPQHADGAAVIRHFRENAHAPSR